MAASPLPDAVNAALRRQIEALREQAAALEGMAAVHHARQRALSAEREEVWRRLLEALAPSVHGPQLGATARRLGSPALEPAHVQDRLRQRKRELERQLDEARSHPALATGPERIAELRARRQELEGHVAALERSVRSLERDPDFCALEDRDFGGELAPGWWTLSYYRLARRAESVVTRHGKRFGATELGALRARYRRERDALATLQEDLASVSGEGRDLAAMCQSIRDAQEELSDLEGRLLEELRHHLARELAALSEDALLAAFADDAAGRAWTRAVSGVAAKTRYLDAVYAHWIERTRLELIARIQDDEIAVEEGARWLRSGPGSTPSEIDADTRARLSDIERRVCAYHAACERLLAFQRYDVCDPLAGDLWWEHMSGGLLDGTFIDEVVWHRTLRRRGRAFGHAHREQRVAAQHQAARRREALAAAALERALDDTDEASSHGPRSTPAPVELPDLEGE